jgi:hypothetical protein
MRRERKIPDNASPVATKVSDVESHSRASLQSNMPTTLQATPAMRIKYFVWMAGLNFFIFS